MLSVIFVLSFLSLTLLTVKAQTVGDILVGQYTYYDPEGDIEAGSTYQWYRDGVAIAGATNINYTVVADDVGHTLVFEVIPKSLTGVTPGVPFRSEGITISNPAPATIPSGGILFVPKASSTSTPVVITYATSSATSSNNKIEIPKNSFLSPVDGKVLQCDAFTFSLNLNSSKNNKEEVKIWQAFLNKEVDAKLPITGYYGKLTFAAVKAFQTKYTDEILKPWGLKKATGYTYKSTRYKANKILGCVGSPIILENGTTINY
ncbi:MAG: hypothetical protein RI945_376 [Candidatus Parcubacteria bacterium]|jgi:peptidoglycan hydrolase-like protein with peptidoglycan-binding domain